MKFMTRPVPEYLKFSLSRAIDNTLNLCYNIHVKLPESGRNSHGSMKIVFRIIFSLIICLSILMAVIGFMTKSPPSMFFFSL